MKILYFGTVCRLDTYEEMLKSCRHRPTVATIVLESALLQGFRQLGQELTVYSHPMIPTFPKCRRLLWHDKKEQLPCGYEAAWLNTVNLPLLKQWSRTLQVRHALRKWLRDNKNEPGVVLVYGINSFVAPAVTAQCRKAGVRCYAIVPDLPEHMYTHSAISRLSGFFKERYLLKAIRVQGQFDGYVYLTEAMKTKLAPDKPYVVMEGIAGEIPVENLAKSEPRGILYAGGLQKKYGLLQLLDAFEAVKPDNTELWLFGDGDAVEEIKKRAAQNPAIRFYGTVTRAEVLKYEQMATLLVNVRSNEETFTKYSFPSKTMEYMLSGTPLLSTRLDGIPEEYYSYIFAVENNSVPVLSERLKEILSLPPSVLTEKGQQAQAFVLQEKSPVRQAQRITEGLLLKETPF